MKIYEEYPEVEAKWRLGMLLEFLKQISKSFIRIYGTISVHSVYFLQIIYRCYDCNVIFPQFAYGHMVQNNVQFYKYLVLLFLFGDAKWIFKGMNAVNIEALITTPRTGHSGSRSSTHLLASSESFLLYSDTVSLRHFVDILLWGCQEKLQKMSWVTDSNICVLTFSPSGILQ